MILVNGQVSGSIAANDRGCLYGDGLFETCRVVNESCQFWSAHLERLLSGCERLGITPPSRSILERERDQALTLARASQETLPPGVLRITLTRGPNARGYAIPDTVVPTRVFQYSPFEGYPEDYYTRGIVVRCCETPLSINPILAGIKHLNRLEQVMARAEWKGTDQYQEGLMQDSEGHVVEGTMSNLFVLKGETLYTPLLNRCGIKGIVRSWLQKAAPGFGLSVVEKDLFIDDVSNADGLLMTNSLLGICPVSEFAGRRFPVPPVAQALQNVWMVAE